MTERAWFVTGAGRGLGRAFAEAALEDGDRVVGTVRTAGALAPLTEDPDRVRELVLDVRDAAAVASVVDEAAAAFGGLDVVVNNAGTGLVGAVEEVDDALARDLFDLNLFGALAVTRAALPHLRTTGGDLVQISTVGAIGTMPTMGLYNASKWALEGFSEALAAEVAAHGVRVTIAELGSFATDWAGSSMPFAPPLAEYDDLRVALFGTTEVPWPVTDDAGSDGADPRVAAEALLAHLSDPDRPLRVLIGDDAREQATMAYGARRDSYGPDPGFTWPS